MIFIADFNLTPLHNIILRNRKYLTLQCEKGMGLGGGGVLAQCALYSNAARDGLKSAQKTHATNTQAKEFLGVQIRMTKKKKRKTEHIFTFKFLFFFSYKLPPPHPHNYQPRPQGLLGDPFLVSCLTHDRMRDRFGANSIFDLRGNLSSKFDRLKFMSFTRTLSNTKADMWNDTSEYMFLP